MSPRRYGTVQDRGIGAPLLLIRRTIALAGSIAVTVALALAACGRAGPLEPPPGPATAPVPSAQASPQVRQADTPLPGVAENAAAQKTGFDSQGNPVATSGQKRPFFLDPILQ
jgi:predicted small lipoprotein YifL